MVARRRKKEDAGTRDAGLRHLNIQIQPERVPSLDLSRVRAMIEAVSHDRTLVTGFRTAGGEDEGPYINFTFAVTNAARLWERIRERVLGDALIGRDFADSSIIICEGEHGWDDYLLLHHFDPQRPLDDVSQR